MARRAPVPSTPGLVDRVEFSERNPQPGGSPVSSKLFPEEQQQQQQPEQQQHPHPHVHAHEWDTANPMRWLVLFEYCLLAFLNGAQWICLSVIPKETSERFSISVYQVDLLSASFYVMFILSAFPAVAFFDKFGVRKSLLVANTCNVAGFATKFAAAMWLHSSQGPEAFAVLLLSNCIAGGAQAFFLPVPSALSCQWFSDEERTLATTIAAVSNPLGGAAGFLITGAFVSHEPRGFGWEKFAMLFGFMTLLNLLDSLLLVCVVPEHPKRAPSEASHLRMLARHEEETLRISLLDRCKKIVASAAPYVKNRDSLFIILGTGLGGGTFWTFTSLIEQIAAPFGISENTVGIMGFLATLLGMPFAIWVSHWVDKNRVYKSPLLMTLNSITILLGLFTLLLWAFPQGAVWIAVPLFVIAGGPQNLVLPLGFEALSEQTFPLDENVCSALILLSSEVLALIMMSVLPAVLRSESLSKQNASVLACFVLVVVNLLAFTLVFFGKVELNRKKTAEIAEQEDDEAAEEAERAREEEEERKH